MEETKGLRARGDAMQKEFKKVCVRMDGERTWFI